MTIRLRKETDELRKRLLHLSALVEVDVAMSVRAVENRDAEVARSVIENDREVDRLEVQFEEECLKVLALYQPVAGDLRYIIAMLKINNDLERIGDQAVNLAMCAMDLAKKQPVELPFDFPEMADKAKQMLKDALDAFVRLDFELARKVMESDDAVDEINRTMYRRVEIEIRNDPEQVTTLILYMTVSRNLERIADLATNISEDVVYLIEGEIVRHGGDSRSRLHKVQ